MRVFTTFLMTDGEWEKIANTPLVCRMIRNSIVVCDADEDEMDDIHDWLHEKSTGLVYLHEVKDQPAIIYFEKMADLVLFKLSYPKD